MSHYAPWGFVPQPRPEPVAEASRPCCDDVKPESELKCSRCGYCKPESTLHSDHCHRCCDFSLPF